MNACVPNPMFDFVIKCCCLLQNRNSFPDQFEFPALMTYDRLMYQKHHSTHTCDDDVQCHTPETLHVHKMLFLLEIRKVGAVQIPEWRARNNPEFSEHEKRALAKYAR